MHAGLIKRLLVVDDDIDLLMLLERFLSKEGYEVETAVSLSEAEEMIPVFSPHLVLLDINVAGEDGRQLCFKLKKLQQADVVKVVVMSGFDLDARRAALFGADELITKPFHPTFLLNRVSAHLFGHAGESELVALSEDALQDENELE